MANKELDAKIRSLHYNPKEVLAYPGNTVEEPIPANGQFDGNTYVVETKEKHTLAHEYNPAIQSHETQIPLKGNCPEYPRKGRGEHRPNLAALAGHCEHARDVAGAVPHGKNHW